jgi:formylglycine-generating enzyme required for sulfatase activity
MFILVCFTSGYVSALPSASPDNPRPDAEDIVLPMPGDSVMVFRAVAVPGSGFWGKQEQIIQIGDASGGIFEGLQRTQISGSFPSEDKDGRLIYLAKYELTKGQFIAVMGIDALLKVSADPEDQKIPQLQGRALPETMMLPLTFVGYHDILDFMRAYNQWMFDPDHPERRKAMPHIDDVPGFFRLPTEEEWEYVARGGIPALEDGSFDDRLPFSQRELNEQAWHLGNAGHRVRPIGLRKPSRLGFYDLFGNLQEMTAGLFRPEIWQGKPGGVAVRGANVSTPAGDIRSAYRQELDVYAWNQDHQRVEERRSFNTGARLAIGSNVVVNSEIRAHIEKEYEEYKAGTRRTMPVGRTLDNLVTQATVQLGTVEPILDRLMEQHPDLRDSLLTVQTHMNNARERLDLAQRESARSLAQDAARNGVNLSVYISRLIRLEISRESAVRLAEISSRYQEQIKAVDARIQELTAATQQQLQGYGQKVGQLGEYESFYIEYALDTLKEGEPLPRERAVLELLSEHVNEFNEHRRADNERWLEEYQERFSRFAD